jgi:hypothetical protein
MKFAMMAWMAVVVGHAAQAHRKLTVHLKIGNDHNLLAPPALTIAQRMFDSIGIDLEWKSWKQSGESPAPIVVEMTADASAAAMPGTLGFATPYEGSHITIFLDRIEKMDYPSVVLAHVLVHEITHIVQGTARHSEFGVMKAHWDGRDLCDMHRHPLAFAPVDLDLIDIGLLARRSAPGPRDVPR